jgi:hypothetical protein
MRQGIAKFCKRMESLPKGRIECHSKESALEQPFYGNPEGKIAD